MSIRKYLKHITIKVSLFILALIGMNFQVSSQEVSVNAKLDSMLMFIGGQMDLTLEVAQPQDVKLSFPVFTDTISKYIEVVDRGKVDTVSIANNRIQLVQKYRITSFDSGVHLVPPIEFEIAGEVARKIATQPMALKVVNPFSDVNPEKGIFDIKKPVNTPFSFAELKQYLLYIISFIILVVAIILILIWRFNRKLITSIIKPEKPLDPPHVIALRELEKIKEEKLWQRDQVKKYYSELTDVLRHYLEARFDISTLEQTSDEIIATVSKLDSIDAKNKDNLKKLLQLADLVKFAKFVPLIDENDLSMINAVFFVNQTKFEEIKSLEEEKKLLEGESDENHKKQLSESEKNLTGN